jgi:hypothetical protein
MQLFALPTIHFNGTSAKSLQEEYHDARKAIEAAIVALISTTCNQRDFYPQEPGAWERARAERMEALTMLRQVKEYAERWEMHASEAQVRPTP